jgi:hypothetical protein
MKQKIWTFGDSFTESFNVPKTFGSHDWRLEYVRWLGRMPKVYGEIMSEKLNYELVNLGKSGSCNDSIFETICLNINKIKDNDIVIIGWSSPLRFRLASEMDNENWVNILPFYKKVRIGEGNSKTLFKNSISDNTLDEIFYNRKSVRYIDEVLYKTQMINKALNKNKVIHWSPFTEYFSEVKSISECTKIVDETNGKINDPHFSEKGHIELSEKLLKMLEFYDKKYKII